MNKLLLILFLLATAGFADSLDDAITMVKNGDISGVLSRMDQLKEQYGKNPSFHFLEAAVEPNGDKAFSEYQQFTQDYPDNKYCTDAMLKVAEYYYVAGLYVRSGEWLKKYLNHAGEKPELERALNLLEKSLTISGNADSAGYYLSLYDKKPSAVSQQQISDVIPELPQSNVPVTADGEYAVQVGIFGSIENASKQIKQLEKYGYTGQIRITIRNGEAMHAVVIGNYATDMEARKVSNRIKASLGLDAFVVKL